MSSSMGVTVLNLHLQSTFLPRSCGNETNVAYEGCWTLLLIKFSGKIPKRNKRRVRHGGRAPEWF